MRRRLPRFPRAVLVAALLGCTALVAGCAPHRNEPATPEQPGRDRTVLDATEIAGRGYANTYVAVSAARPEWLRVITGPPTATSANGRGNGPNARFPTAAQVARATGESSNSIGVFVEGSKQPEGMNYLSSLAVEHVASLKHISGSEAMAMYGPEWAWGAIIVRLRQ